MRPDLYYSDKVPLFQKAYVSVSVDFFDTS